MKKYAKIFVIVFTALLVISWPVFYNSSTTQVFPFKSPSEFEVSYYKEPIETGVSTAAIENKDTLVLQYQLGDGSIDPFVGFFITKKNSTDSFFNFSTHSHIKIKLSSTHGKRIPITYTVSYPGFTKPNQELTNIPFTTILDYDTKGEYNIAIKDFKEQSWWFRENSKKQSDFPCIDLSRVNYLVIGSCQVLGKKGSDQIKIESIELYNDNRIFIMAWLIIATGGYGLALLLKFYKKEKKVLVPYLSQDVSCASGDKLVQITNYFALHYSNPELSKSDLESHLGISSREIGTLLKENLNTSFKNYLNQIRLAEVKRQLSETNQPISQIAYNCGYNNISHFNRVFKSEIGMSPKQFKENN